MAAGTNSLRKAAQRRIVAAIDERSLADFSSLPDEERIVPVDVLQELFSESGDVDLCCPLRIRGAAIEGPLRPPTSTRLAGRVALQFIDCEFDSPVDLSGADLLVLRFLDCRMPAFIGTSIRVSAELDFSGSQFSGIGDYDSEFSRVAGGSIHLTNARIGGHLCLASTEKSRFEAHGMLRLDGARIDGEIFLAGARLDGDGGTALSARSVTVGSNVDLSAAFGNRFEADGEVIFAAANITGDLNCTGARLHNPNGRALHCEDLRVESVLLSSNLDAGHYFEARGRLNFLTAIIGGSFFMTNASLAPGPDYTGVLRKGGPIALNLQQARISNALAVNNVRALGDGPASLDDPYEPVRGWFVLTGAELNVILDNLATGWPASGFLDLDGVLYERIRNIDGGDLTKKRLAWLRLQFDGGNPGPEGFSPQPYEQLSRVLRQHGLSKEANDVAVEKIRMRLASRVDKPLQRFFPSLLMLISRNGYSTSRAILSFVVFVLAGAAMYAAAVFGFGQGFVPVEHDPSPVTYQFAFGLLQAESENGCPGLDVLHYALDAALPVIDLAQDLRCRFTPEGPLKDVWLMLHSLFVIAGAALSAVVVLTLTGVLRQD